MVPDKLTCHDQHHLHGALLASPREGQRGVPSLDQAVGFLANGWADADLSQISVIAPDGSVALDGQELLDAMQTHLHG